VKGTQVVQRFLAAANRNDVEGMLGLLAPDCVYHNIPVSPVSGIDAIRQVLRGFMGMASEVDWVTHRMSECSDGTVLTERTDRFLVAGKWIELPVMGAFAVRDGKIQAWRDYFDMAQFQRQLPSAGGKP
jgi:limonene-1,2-epoxide hydrolase